jgi:5-formyltetrahydrofolate cyclo-ligase
MDRAIQARLTGLAEITRANTVFCYISCDAEADTRVLLQQLLDGGKQVCVPRVTSGGEIEAVTFSGWTGLVPGPYGIPAPAGTDTVTGTIDLCITPGLGFGVNGGRLGQGLGYYDRWFAAHTVVCKIGLAYECQIVTDLPVEPHDAMMDIIITEQRTIRP